jgi:hypothetical protein
MITHSRKINFSQSPMSTTSPNAHTLARALECVELQQNIDKTLKKLKDRLKNPDEETRYFKDLYQIALICLTHRYEELEICKEENDIVWRIKQAVKKLREAREAEHTLKRKSSSKKDMKASAKMTKLKVQIEKTVGENDLANTEFAKIQQDALKKVSQHDPFLLEIQTDINEKYLFDSGQFTQKECRLIENCWFHIKCEMIGVKQFNAYQEEIANTENVVIKQKDRIQKLKKQLEKETTLFTSLQKVLSLKSLFKDVCPIEMELEQLEKQMQLQTAALEKIQREFRWLKKVLSSMIGPDSLDLEIYVAFSHDSPAN